MDPPGFDPRTTTYFRILDELTRDIASRASRSGTDLATVEAQFRDCEDLFSWLQSVATEATGLGSGSEGWWNLWLHKMRDPREIRREDFPYIDTSENSHLVHFVPAYLKQPARSRTLDRIYVDMLIASELYVRADAVYCRYVADASDDLRRLEHVADLMLCDALMLFYNKLASGEPVAASEILAGAEALMPCGIAWPKVFGDLLAELTARNASL